MTGGLEMHPLFISIGNIPGHVRMAATSHTWQCIAFMPIPKFEAPKGCQSVLQNCVWHKCIKIITAGLQYLARTGGFILDPHGHQHLCFTPLAAWTAVSQSVDLGRSNNPNTTPTKDYKNVRVVVYLRGVQRGYAEEGERGSTPTG